MAVLRYLHTLSGGARALVNGGVSGISYLRWYTQACARGSHWRGGAIGLALQIL